VGKFNPRLIVPLTERGQVSMPASFRRQLRLKPGQPLRWERISDDECRIRVIRRRETKTAKSMRGFMKQFQEASRLPANTAGWMKLLRDGEGG